MKKILITFKDGRQYVVGFSSSLDSFIETLKEDINYSNAIEYRRSNPDKPILVYHTGHEQEVWYSSREIIENERVFYKVEI